MNSKVLKLLSKLKEPQETPAESEKHLPSEQIPAESGRVGRRSFLQKAGLGGLSLGGLMTLPLEDQLAYSAKGKPQF